jgi:hypothetical protein
LVAVPLGDHTDAEIASALGIPVDAVCRPVRRTPDRRKKGPDVFVTIPSVADGEALYERMGANPVHIGAGTLIRRYMRRTPYAKIPLRIHPPLHQDEGVAVLRALGGVRADKLQALKFIRDVTERTRFWNTGMWASMMTDKITQEHPNGASGVEESPPLVQDIDFRDFESAMRVKKALNGKAVPSGATLRVDIVFVNSC